MPGSLKVGIEVGGTFTDLFAVSADGEVLTAKVPSTPENPGVGALDALDALLERRAVGEIDEVRHGSTVATNSLLERRGPRLGLIATSGFRDVLLLQRQKRTAIYDVFYRKPEHLVPRHLTREVTERIGPDGSVLAPLDEAGLIRATRELLEEHGVDALAVAFLHSYKNPAHEQAARRLLAERFPDLPVTLSSDILPEFREYERASTTVISAFLQPSVRRYIEHIGGGLGERDFAGRFFVLGSDGGVMTPAAAYARPERLLLSGPAAGVAAAAFTGVRCGMPNLLTLDMGGTSTDVSLVTGGRPEVVNQGELAALPVKTLRVDVVTIGAGGGSIASVDAGGMLRVGPVSAGARPGPACYDRGGSLPTLTDALVNMGLVDPERFLGGEMSLRPDLGAEAVRALGERLGRSVEEVSEDIFAVACANVSDALRVVTVRRGRDPRDYTLCAYGGAGPMLGAFAAERVQMARVVVPPSAGLFSAVGLLASRFTVNHARTHIVELTEAAVPEIRATFAGLRRAAEADFREFGVPLEGMTLRLSVDMRYAGQGYELTVPVPVEALAGSSALESLRAAFNGVHEETYGHSAPAAGVEAVTFRLTALGLAEPQMGAPRAPDAAPAAARAGSIFLGGVERACEFLDRASLAPGARVSGPAVVSEATSTTVVPPGWRAEVDAHANIVMEREAA